MKIIRQLRRLTRSLVLRVAISEFVTKLSYLFCVLLGVIAYFSHDYERTFIGVAYLNGLGIAFLLVSAVIRTVHFLKLERDMFAASEAIRFAILFTFMICSFAWLYSLFGLKHSSGIVTHSLLDAIYFSITTITTLGYGDYLPVRSMQLLTSIEALCGLMTVPLLASLVWLIVDLKSGPADKTFIKQLESNLKAHIADGGVEAGDVLTEALVADISGALIDIDAIQERIASSLAKDTQKKTYDEALDKYSVTRAAIFALCSAFENDDLFDKDALRNETKIVINAAYQLDTLHWHSLVLYAAHHKKSIAELAAIVEAECAKQLANESSEEIKKNDQT